VSIIKILKSAGEFSVIDKSIFLSNYQK